MTDGAGVRARADIVFPRRRLVVFVDGCFWHGCPEHCRVPTRNRTYWQAKLERNMTRDARVGAALTAAGWRVLRVWEHEVLERAVSEVLERAVSKVEAALSGELFILTA